MFKKGQSGNISGRPKGALQATTKQVRDILTNILNDHLDQVYEDLASLSPKDRIAAIVAISQIIVPRMAALAIETSETRVMTTVIDWSEPNMPILEG